VTGVPLRPPPTLVSVVIPVLDATETLEAQLRAVAAQDFAGDWEVVVADGGSTDGGVELAQRWAAGLARARAVDVSVAGRGPEITRNAGARAAGGDFLAFCDADDVAAPGWLSALVAAGREADIAAGWLDVESLNAAGVRAWHETPAWDSRHPFRSFLPHVSSANLGVWRDVFWDIGGFTEGMAGAEDRELAWRAQLDGRRVARAPDAVVAYRYRPTPRATALQHFGWGRAEPRLYRRFRRAGLRRTRLRDALRAWAWLVVSVPALPWSERRRGMWAAQAGLRAGQLVGSVRNRVVFL
jgi:glycosyltransferase involved in cell wall biosynthesis